MVAVVAHGFSGKRYVFVTPRPHNHGDQLQEHTFCGHCDDCSLRLNLCRLRHSKNRASSPRSRPLVGIAADGASSYGRGITRGAMQYVNAQRRWEIHTALRRTFEADLRWPACDGAIIAGVGVNLDGLIKSKSRHIVSCSGSADPSDTIIVSLDDRAAGAMAAQHLMDCQLKAFSFYGGGTSPHSNNRERGFTATLAAHAHSYIPCPVQYVVGELDMNPHWPALTQWLKSLPTPAGILAVDDTAAQDLAAACRHANIGVPEHIAIIGVNNDDLICDSAWSPLSSVDAGYPRIGYEAARVLDRLIAGEKLTREERVTRLPPLRVVQRLSTDILAVDDPQVADALRFIREHACDPCSVDAVLRQVPVGRRWLERQFERKLGRTPRDEILRVQIESAKRLLLQPGMILPMIAERCGFSDASTFGRAFLRSAGTSPAAFRRNALAYSH
jgi:LacI family transcriptional regulator